MDRKKAEAILTLSGFKILAVKPLVDGYRYHPDDPRFFENLPRCVWWFIKTEIGWIEIGLRKKVISIDWSDTAVREVMSKDEVTSTETYIHAWTEEKAVEYLKELHKKANQK